MVERQKMAIAINQQKLKIIKFNTQRMKKNILKQDNLNLSKENEILQYNAIKRRQESTRY